jgi:hypothetical protein
MFKVCTWISLNIKGAFTVVFLFHFVSKEHFPLIFKLLLLNRSVLNVIY